MDGLKLHGQSSEAAIAGQPESRVLLEDLPVEMDTNICSHVLWTNLQHLGTDESGEKELWIKETLSDAGDWITPKSCRVERVFFSFET